MLLLFPNLRTKFRKKLDQILPPFQAHISVVKKVTDHLIATYGPTILSLVSSMAIGRDRHDQMKAAIPRTHSVLSARTVSRKFLVDRIRGVLRTAQRGMSAPELAREIYPHSRNGHLSLLKQQIYGALYQRNEFLRVSRGKYVLARRETSEFPGHEKFN